MHTESDVADRIVPDRIGMESAATLQPVAAGRPAPYGYACANCSKAKCRCITRGPGNSCERYFLTVHITRCHRLGKDCTPSTVVRKRGSKKQTSSNRKEQLEQKLDGLVSLRQTQSGLSKQQLDNHLQQHTWPPQTAAFSSTQQPLLGLPENSRNILFSQTVPTPATTARETTRSPPESCNSTQVDELSPAEADGYLQNFRTYNLRFFPFIYIPEHVTAQQLQRERPFLWLAIRATCAKSSDEQAEFATRIREMLGQQLVVEAERNIDLLLCILTFTAWSMYYYIRGKPYLRLSINLATAIISDLGIDKPSPDDLSAHIRCLKPYKFPKWSGGIKALTNEHRRAYAATFICGSFISSFMSLQTLKWTTHLANCVQKLEDDGECPGDAILVAMARIFQVADDAAQITRRIGENDHDVGPGVLHIKGLQASLDQIKSKLSPKVLENYIIQTHLSSTEVLIYEMVWFAPPRSPLHATYDFRRVEFLHSCLHAAKAHMDSFLTCSPADYCCMSFAIMVQFSHSAQVIYRLAILDEPGWDQAVVLKTVNLLDYLECFAGYMEEYHRMAASQQGETCPDALLFRRGAQTLQSTIPSWRTAFEQASAVVPDGATSASVPAEDVTTAGMEPINFMDFSDDAWLTDMIASWDG